ncbi:MAG: hypothetical protein DCC71_18680 [Proteobacteria bacterium]|nr:MAG: hypothetical protein DCC71_18680 [Pseudomonadota bacterium]
MQLLALPGFLAFFFVSLWVGVRLLLQARRTRELPELLLGVGVLCIGPVGFGLVMLAAAAGARDPHAPSWIAGLSACAVAAGASAKAIFNWKIYHPRSRAVAAFAFAGIGALALAIVGDGMTTGFAPASWMQPGWVLLRQFVQIAVLLWGASEALFWWRRMGRRLRIGIGDPLVANRFLLWAIGAGMAGLGSAIGLAVGLVHGRPMNELPELTLAMSLFGTVSAVSLWLAFAAPAFYKRWVRAPRRAEV